MAGLAAPECVSMQGLSTNPVVKEVLLSVDFAQPCSEVEWHHEELDRSQQPDLLTLTAAAAGAGWSTPSPTRPTSFQSRLGTLSGPSTSGPTTAD